MGIKIFDVDPDGDNAPSGSQFPDDIVGRFRSGYQANRRPVALQEWRITTGDPDVADVIVANFGGEAKEWDTDKEDNLEVFTTTSSIDIILDDPGAIRTSMVLWGRNGKIRECDGVEQCADEGQAPPPCVCPSTVKERKEAAKKGSGCQPSIQVYFRLATNPDLGKFNFFSGSWALASEVRKAEEKLAEIDGPAYARLSLKVVEYEAKTGPKKGQTVSFTKPVVEVLGPVEED